jgi:hypothetical protein
VKICMFVSLGRTYGDRRAMIDEDRWNPVWDRNSKRVAVLLVSSALEHSPVNVLVFRLLWCTPPPKSTAFGQPPTHLPTHPMLIPAICKASNMRHINSVGESSISVRLSFSLRPSYLPSLYRPFHSPRDSQISIAAIAPCPAIGTTPAPTTMDGCR